MRKTATNSRANAGYFNCAKSSFTLLTCPATMGKSFHLSFQTLQHTGHPHPVLPRSTLGIPSLSPNAPCDFTLLRRDKPPSNPFDGCYRLRSNCQP
jgi:hypothetical protein